MSKKYTEIFIKYTSLKDDELKRFIKLFTSKFGGVDNFNNYMEATSEKDIKKKIMELYKFLYF